MDLDNSVTMDNLFATKVIVVRSLLGPTFASVEQVASLVADIKPGMGRARADKLRMTLNKHKWRLQVQIKKRKRAIGAQLRFARCNMST